MIYYKRPMNMGFLGYVLFYDSTICDFDKTILNKRYKIMTLMACVFQQSGIKCKRLTTNVTRIWFFFSVRYDVVRHSFPQRKRLATNVTRIRFFFGVRHHVRSQITILCKRLAINVTQIRGFSSVRHHVVRHSVNGHKYLVTIVTRIRVFFCVGSCMVRQMEISRKRFQTNITRITSFSDTHLHVRRQIAFLREWCYLNTTRTRVYDNMYFLVVGSPSNSIRHTHTTNVCQRNTQRKYPVPTLIRFYDWKKSVFVHVRFITYARKLLILYIYLRIHCYKSIVVVTHNFVVLVCFIVYT